MNPRLGSTDFLQAVRTDPRIPGNHPALFSVGLARRLNALLASGAIPSERVAGRFYIDPAHAPRAAELLGLIATRKAA
ncbi:hypothetical protein [Roseicella aquatilis]|uniref:Uncharacterized protein n=1 Tax=Roseicella aquatilis TaxID=2527868 RepID=A0A4R4DSJ2_9PROT|nr:hypothetical protein [Roseicella aquatilis]TCZ65564.1 hypothetical protein EXY23_05185 [Roseicella aquatilis]